MISDEMYQYVYSNCLRHQMTWHTNDIYISFGFLNHYLLLYEIYFQANFIGIGFNTKFTFLICFDSMFIHLVLNQVTCLEKEFATNSDVVFAA